MKKIKYILMTLALVAGLTGVLAPEFVGAVNAFNTCTSTSESDVCGAQSDSIGSYVAIITNTLLFILGAVSVIVIIYAGIRYATSGGDPGRVSAAKNTLLYAVIGLVVAILAYSIVNFVILKIGNK